MEAAQPSPIGTVIAGRYRVQRELGRGGMAAVYAVHDERASRTVALKRCIPRERGKALRYEAMLEREYHTLAQLAHPRIIAVHDFGVDAGGPYYTMELLEGTDLQTVDRLPWRSACVALRDVASALAMLHSRGVVHRDVSMRNVYWSAGHAKLIDFGAMTTLGVAKDVVGTPPFAAPESVQLQALDGRADLFSLGALAYRLLTGRHAYPARRFADLRDSWRSRPASPTALVPDVPPELSALVQRLLCVDRAARPRSAAEVMEQLRTIAQLEQEDEALISRAYLMTPALVGRDAAVVAIRRHVLALVRGDGGVLAVRGASGSGRSRMLDACALEGKLLSPAVVRVDARDASSGAWGVARALGKQLVAQFPKQAAEAARLSRSVLAHIIEDLPVDDETAVTGYAPERSVIIRDYRDWVCSISKSQRLIIVVDDAERLDEPSVAILSAIASRVDRHPILIAITLPRDAKLTAPHLQLLDDLSQSVQLEQLEPPLTEALLKSVFGNGPNLAACAARIHRLSDGQPRTVMELAQHLVDTQQAHYEAGSWVLPDRLDESDLPSTLAASMLARLAELSGDARELADVLALADEDELEVAQYAELSSHRDRARVIRALNELVAARILMGSAERVLFAQSGFVSFLRQVMAGPRRRELHERIASLLPSGPAWEVRRCHHLLAAGQDAEAIAGLLRLEVGTQPPPVALWQAALERAERAAMPAATLHRLRMGILLSAPYSLDYAAFRLAVPAVFARLDEESGLAAYRQLSELPDAERLPRALATAQQLYVSRAPQERVYPPVDAIRELARMIATISSMAAPGFDLAQIEALPNLEPLFPLSPSLVVVAQVVGGTREWISGRLLRARTIFEGTLSRIAEPDRGGLDAAQHERMRLSLHYILATLDAMAGIQESAERRAQLLERERGTRITAWRIRQLLQMALGNTAEAEKNARRAALLEAQQGVSARYMNATAGMELVLRARLGDLLGVKASVETLERLATQHPGWRPVELLGRALYCQLQGDLEGGLRHVVEGLELAPPCRHPFFSALARVHLSLLADLGRRDEALELARQYIRVCVQEQLPYEVCVYGSLLFARAGLIDEAVRTLTPIIEAAEALGCAGLALGLLYATRCRIAVAARDLTGARRWFELCTAQYQKANNPGLNAELVRLLDEAAASGVPLTDQSASLRHSLTSITPSKEQHDTIHSRIAECVDDADRARCMLTLMLERLLSTAGYLYIKRPDQTPSLIAALPDLPGDPQVAAWVDRYAHDWLQRSAANDSEDAGQTGTLIDDESASETASAMSATMSDEADHEGDAYRYIADDGHSLEAVVLTTDLGSETRLAAVLVVDSVPGQRAYVPYALSSTLARELLEHGDSIGWR